MRRRKMEETKTMNTALPVKHIPSPKQLRMTSQVFAAICETIGTRRAETGGILGGKWQTGEVTHFFFDKVPRVKTSSLYVPNNAILNEVRKNQWKPQGVDYLGSIHSHPPGFCSPSSGDKYYAGRILETLEIPYLLVPIVITLADTGSMCLYPFAAVLDGGRVKIIEQELVVGGNLIRLAKPAMPDKREDAEKYLLIIMELELSLNAMLYSSMPWAGRHPLRQRRDRYERNERFTNEYD
jgi:proteasome lid subunit RPN8/RPN11